MDERRHKLRTAERPAFTADSCASYDYVASEQPPSEQPETKVGWHGARAQVPRARSRLSVSHGAKAARR
eukprot:674214-Alexandrium_andersonii.AAC.1